MLRDSIFVFLYLKLDQAFFYCLLLVVNLSLLLHAYMLSYRIHHQHHQQKTSHQVVLFINSFATIMWMELADNYCEVLERSAYCYLYDSVTDAPFQRNKVLFLRSYYKPKSYDNNYYHLPIL
jgi:hypothetical protein